MLRVPLRFAALALFGISASHAASTLDVQITLTIPDIVAVEWAGGLSGTSSQTWAIGSATLSGTYETIAPDGTWTDNMRITNPTNNTNTTVDINVAINATTAWSDGAAAAADTYVVKTRENATDASDLNTNGTIVRTAGTDDFINDLASGATTNEIDFQLNTPTSITSGAGASQTITVRFTASADNGD